MNPKQIVGAGAGLCVASLGAGDEDGAPVTFPWEVARRPGEEAAESISGW